MKITYATNLAFGVVHILSDDPEDTWSLCGGADCATFPWSSTTYRGTILCPACYDAKEALA